MNSEQEALEILRRIESNLAKGLEVQNEYLALAKQNFLKSEAVVEKSIKLQEISVSRQKRIQAITLPILIFLVASVLYLGFKWNVF